MRLQRAPLRGIRSASVIRPQPNGPEEILSSPFQTNLQSYSYKADLGGPIVLLCSVICPLVQWLMLTIKRDQSFK